MAHTNLSTGKIYGALEGTKTYYHEEGHLKFEDESHIGSKVRTIQDLSFKSMIYLTALCVVLPLSILKFLIIVSLSSHLFSEMYEERWCWWYANKKLEIKKESDEGTTQNKV